MKYLILFILIISLSCKSKTATTSEMVTTDSSNPLTLVLSEQYGGTETPEFQVIRDAGALKRFFMKINRTRKPGLPVPDIDFTKEILVLYCSGKTTTGSPDTSLYLMEEQEESLVFAVKPPEKSENQSNSAVIQPFNLYKMPITEKEIVLENPK